MPALIGWIIGTILALGASAYYQKKLVEDASDANKGIFINKTGASNGLRIIYGTRRVGAIKVWKNTSRKGINVGSTVYDKFVGSTAKDNNHGGTTSAKNWLHRLDVWGQGPIESIENYHIDGDEHINTRFTSGSHPIFRSISFYGSNTQVAPAALVAEEPNITSDMRGKGIAYSWNRFLFYDKDVQYQGEPQVTATVKGLKVWDPRTNPTNSSIKTWSNNPALCLLDYLMADYGKGLVEADLDIATFITAANSCDSTVSIPNVPVSSNATDVWYDPTTGEDTVVNIGDTYSWFRPGQNTTTNLNKRFQCDLVLEPKDNTSTNVEKILKTMKGTLPFTQGKYKLVLEDVGTSVMSFDEDTLLGALNISFADRAKRLNRVTIKFPNKNKGYEEDLISYPATDSLQYSNYIAEDNGEELHQEITLEGVTDYYQAEDLAEFIVKDSRTQAFVSFKAQPSAIVLEPNDIIAISHPSTGWTNKQFRVRSLTINSDLSVNLNAQEYDSTIYQWGTKDVEPLVPYVKIDAFKTPDTVQNLTATAIQTANGDGTVVSGFRTTWDDISNDGQGAHKIFLKYFPQGTTTNITSITLPAGEDEYEVSGLPDDTNWTIEVYYQNRVGNESLVASVSVNIPRATTTVDTVVAGVSQAAIDAAAAQAAATAAAANAAQATTDAATAQAAANAAQADANTNASDVVTAIANAAAAQSTATNAQNSANLKQTSAEVLAAIAADTTVIDGARITTGTIDAARISLSGKNISDLNNDSGFTNDAIANTAVANAATAAANAATAAANAATAQAAANAAQADANTNATDVATAQAAAVAAQAAANAATATANAAQTSAEVQTAIANDTTVIDGARITTGTIAAGRIDIAGKNISDLTNNSGFTNDAAANAAQATANAAQTAAEVQSAIANDTTIIDGARITTGTVSADKINVTNLVLPIARGTVSNVGPWHGNQMRLIKIADLGTAPGIYRGYVRIFGSNGEVKTLSVVLGDGTFGGSGNELRSNISINNELNNNGQVVIADTGYAQYHSGQTQYFSQIDRFFSTKQMVQLDVSVRKTSNTSRSTSLYILAQGNGSYRYLSSVQYAFQRFAEV
tara:strand:- start:7087 stop:10362 length:3276 start_codon:yes stop_codon:yes gene_type:complete